MRNSYSILLGSVVALLLLLGIIYSQMPHSRMDGFTSGVDVFTLYYADWCPHCQAVKPAFKTWSNKGSIIVNGKTVFLSMVEADSNPDKMVGKPVKGYPTFLLEKADGSFKEFEGERSPSGWEAWLKSVV